MSVCFYSSYINPLSCFIGHLGRFTSKTHWGKKDGNLNCCDFNLRKRVFVFAKLRFDFCTVVRLLLTSWICAMLYINSIET